MKKIDAILIAAGFSKRFGEKDKLLIPFRGKPLARYTVELACGLDFNRVIFVIANNEVASLADGFDVVKINNKHPERGQQESVRLGVLASDADFYMFFSCDQPLLDSDTVRAIARRAEEGKIVYPVHKEMLGNPCLFSKKYRRDFLELKNGQPPRLIKQRYRQSCVEVQITSKNVLADVDTQADIERLLELSK